MRRLLQSPFFEAFVLVALFAWLVWYRVHGVEEEFLLLFDQIRDWDVVLRGARNLPLGGVPSSAGGTTVGPAYYWILWGIASLVGPAFDYLPHAGGIGISLVQALADIVLAWAVARRTGSLALGVAVALLCATSVRDAIFSSTIWNPPVAEALLKVAIATVLVDDGRSRASALLVGITAWMAVHCHTASVLISAPLLVWTVLQPAVAGQRRETYVRAGVMALAIGLLQVPWAINTFRVGIQGQTQIADSLQSVAGSPLVYLRVADSTAAFSDHVGSLLAFPWSIPAFALVIAAGGVLLVVFSRDARLAVTGPLPLLLTIAAFSLWQGPEYERYWYLVCLPSAAITLAAWPGFLPWPRAKTVVGLVLLAVMLAAQPVRFPMVRNTVNRPGYGAMVRGCRTIVENGRPVVTVRAPGPLMPTVEPLWLCSILNVPLSGDATEVAVIDLLAGGTVRYEAVSR